MWAKFASLVQVDFRECFANFCLAFQICRIGFLFQSFVLFHSFVNVFVHRKTLNFPMEALNFETDAFIFNECSSSYCLKFNRMSHSEWSLWTKRLRLHSVCISDSNGIQHITLALLEKWSTQWFVKYTDHRHHCNDKMLPSDWNANGEAVLKLNKMRK